MTKTGSKLRKLIKLRKILRHKMLTRTMKYLTAAVFSLTTQGNTIETDNLPGSVKNDKKTDRSEWRAEAVQKQFLTEEINLEEEINKRVDWYMQQYVDTLKSSLNEIKEIKTYKQRKKYISENFFNKVYQYQKYESANFYCIAGAMSSLSRLNDDTGDLDNFFPEVTSSEAHAMIYCPAFEKFVSKKYKGCVKEYSQIRDGKGKPVAKGVLDINKLKKGMVLLQRSERNTSSGWHAVVYKGDEEVISLNRDGIFKLQKNIKTKVIDLPEILRREWRERIKEMENLQQQTPQEMIALLSKLYAGRENEFMANFEGKKSAADLYRFQPVAIDLAPNLSDMAKFKMDKEKIDKLEVVDLTGKSPKPKTVVPWKVFAKIAGKNLES